MLILLGLVPLSSIAAQQRIQIKGIIEADADHADFLILEKDQGRVYQVNDAHVMPAIRLALELGAVVDLEVTGKKTITAARVMNQKSLTHTVTVQPDPTPAPGQTGPVVIPTPPSVYEATVIQNDRNFLKKLFNEMTPDSNFRYNSQCFRRAHTWSYDMYDYDNVKSMKAFLFFTPRYIREYGFDWWFHVAPFVYFKTADGVTHEVILDKSLAPGGGVEMNDWATAFMENHVNCPEIQKYQDYEANVNKDYCLIRKVPMYYYQPDNVEALDKEGKVLTDFQQTDLIDMNAQSWRKRPIRQSP